VLTTFRLRRNEAKTPAEDSAVVGDKSTELPHGAAVGEFGKQ